MIHHFFNRASAEAGIRAIAPKHIESRGRHGSPGSGTPSRRKIWLKGVARDFSTPRGSSFSALANIELEVRLGEFLCIVGPSGCGKSTLLHLIAGLDKPSAGEIWIDGRRVERPGPDRLLIFQELGLFPWLTVRENVEFGLRMKAIKRRERLTRSKHYLRLVHLSQFADHYTHQLSGGMKQRVALARALAMQPDVLLMDEPFAALDAQTRDLLHDELERIWAETGQTIVFVTHNVREAVRLGDRVVVLTFRPGQIKSEFRIGLPRPRHLEDAALALAAKGILEKLREEIDKSVRAEYGHENSA
ncbi:MAG TPA: ABC transporter ATP-binding protein [Candidatus Acidoferrales bacterium]|nr:ABC transporter ATP-binding protein [Candidatus Acidoferrales bacterium]